MRYLIPRCLERGVGLGSACLRIRPAPALAAAFGHRGFLKSGDMAIPDTCYPNNQEHTSSQDPNPFCPNVMLPPLIPIQSFNIVPRVRLNHNACVLYYYLAMYLLNGRLRQFKCWYSNVDTQMYYVFTEMEQMHCAAIPTTPCAHAAASKACNCGLQ